MIDWYQSRVSALGLKGSMRKPPLSSAEESDRKFLKIFLSVKTLLGGWESPRWAATTTMLFPSCQHNGKNMLFEPSWWKQTKKGAAEAVGSPKTRRFSSGRKLIFEPQYRLCWQQVSEGFSHYTVDESPGYFCSGEWIEHKNFEVIPQRWIELKFRATTVVAKVGIFADGI